MAHWLVWAGGVILIAVIPWMLWDLFTYAILTPPAHAAGCAAKGSC